MKERSSIILLQQTDIKIAESIYQLFQRSYAIEATLIGVDSFPPLKRSVQKIQNSKTQFWGYHINDTLAAIAEIELENKLLDIHSFVVLPSFFRKGIGSDLLTYLLTIQPIDSAIVETATANKPAIQLYQKFGFMEEKIWKVDEINKIRLRFNPKHKKSDTLY